MYATLLHMPLNNHAPKSESEQKNTLGFMEGVFLLRLSLRLRGMVVQRHMQ